jgi:hypothetical protein
MNAIVGMLSERFPARTVENHELLSSHSGWSVE